MNSQQKYEFYLVKTFCCKGDYLYAHLFFLFFFIFYKPVDIPPPPPPPPLSWIHQCMPIQWQLLTVDTHIPGTFWVYYFVLKFYHMQNHLKHCISAVLKLINYSIFEMWSSMVANSKHGIPDTCQAVKTFIIVIYAIKYCIQYGRNWSRIY